MVAGGTKVVAATGTYTFAPTITSRAYTAGIFVFKGASGATTFTKTASLGALLQKAGITKTASLGALVQKQGITKTASLGSILVRVGTKTASLGALLQKLGATKTTALGALLQKAGVTRTASLGALLVKVGTKTTALGALLRKNSLTRTTSLGSLLQKVGVTKTTSLGSLLKKAGVTRTASLGSLLRKTITKTVSLGAILSLTASVTKTLSLGALLRKTVALTVGLDARLVRAVSPFETLINSPRSLAFFTVEFDGFIPASGTAAADELAWLAAPPLALSLESDTIDNTTTFRAADVSYISDAGSPIGQQFFPPLVKTAFTLDQRINLLPTANAVMAAWGQVELDNPRGPTGVGYWDNVATSHNVQGRAIAIKMGAKPFETLRQMNTEPGYSSLYQVFAGVMNGLFLDLKTMTLGIRDIGYLLEKPLQSELYAGTGGAEGNAELTGKPKPMTRGGTALKPVPNVTPVLIDPVNRIYQYSNGPGTVVNLYERALATFTADGNVASTYAGLAAASVPSGHFATANAVAMFKLGTTPVGEITADVTGEFPSAGAVTTVVGIAKAQLSDDLAIDAALIDSPAFATLDAAYPYVGGFYIGAEQVSAVDQLGMVMGSINGRLVVGNAGKFRPIALTAAAGMPKDEYTTAEIVDLRPQQLPAELLTPVFSWQVGYQHNHTVQTSDIAPTVTDARRQFLANEYRFATASSSDVLSQYRFLNTPAPLPSILLDGADAQAVADSLIALWSARRRLYDVAAIVDVLQRDIGDVVNVTYPMDDMANGKLATVVGRSLAAPGRTASLLVLA